MFLTDNTLRVLLGAACSSVWWAYALYGLRPSMDSPEFPGLFVLAMLLSIMVACLVVSEGCEAAEAYAKAQEEKEEEQK